MICMPQRALKRAAILWIGIFLLYGCEGSGGCGGCDGMEPIPNGFPLEDRVENGVQVRVTEDGIDFIEQEIEPIIEAVMGGALAVEVPRSDVDLTVGSAVICPRGPCYISISIDSVNIAPSPPNEIQLHINIQAWTSDEFGTPAPMSMDISILGTSRCNLDVDTENSGQPVMPVTGRVILTIDPATRYTEFEIADLNATDGFEIDDIELSGEWQCTIASWLVGLFEDMLVGALNGMLTEPLEEISCRPCTEDEDCPLGSSCGDNDTCVDTEGECVAPLLGIEGRVDFGALLASTSPGVNSEIDFLAALGGYAQATESPSGLSLGMFGGSEPFEISTCVPHADPPSLGPVGQSQTIANGTSCPTCPEGTETHAIIGVSETLLDRIGWALHQSGGLCLGIGPETIPVSSGLLGMMIRSLDDLTWGDDRPIAIELRPAVPPTFEVGPGTEEDPLLVLNMPDTSIDFYIWAFDRWVMLFRVTADLAIDMSLEAVAGEISFGVNNIGTENLVITHSEIIDEDPADLAASFEGLISSFLGPMLGTLGSFALPDISGITILLPDGSIGHLEETDGEEFLMLYAALGVSSRRSGGPGPWPIIRTEAEITELDIPPTEEFAATNGPPTLPRIYAQFGAQGSGEDEVEYRWRLNTSLWSQWTTETDHIIESGILLFQGHHTLEVQARLYRQPETEDPEPIILDVLIDTVAPEVEIGSIEENRIVVAARDLVSTPEDIELDYRIVGEETWRDIVDSQITLSGDPEEIEIRATDEAGNIGVSRHALRGRLPAEPSDCGGCASTGSSGRTPIALGLIVLVGWLILRRRRESAVIIALIASLSLGACGSGNGGTDGDADGDSDGDADADEETGVCVGDECCEDDGECTTGRCCMETGYCVTFTEEDDTCEEGSCEEIPLLDENCEFEACSSCGLERLEVGLIGLYSSVAIAADGAAWVAAYAKGRSERYPYGDLAVARVTSDSNIIADEDWIAIDGVPGDGEVVANPLGFREGIEDPGPHVGKYASIAADGDGNLGIAYYDVDNGSLKFILGNADSWDAPVVVDGQNPELDAGRYADLIFLPSGVPAIAYMTISIDAGVVVTTLRYIQATDAAGSSWSDPVDLDVMDPTPCNATLCTGENVYCDLELNRCMASTSDCTEDCAEDEQCINGQCHNVVTTAGDLPEGTGLWPDLAAGPSGTIGVICYDRTNGDLISALYDGKAWGPSQIVAGQTGDVGWTPSLMIDDAGIWHMTAVDGVNEDLLYLTSDGTTEVIDGRSLGEHYSIRGDDSSLVLLPNGNIRAVYQDVTELQFWMAERDDSGIWSTQQLNNSTLNDTATEGFFAGHIPEGDSSVATAWYYDPLGEANGVVVFWL